VRRVTVNELVAYNMAFYRRAADMTQEQLGQKIGGWSTASVSAAERSWDGKRVRKFDADELFALAYVLGVPVGALLLPPEDHRAAVNYEVISPAEDEAVPAIILIVLAAGGGQMPAEQADSPVLRAYRGRLIAAGVTEKQPKQEPPPPVDFPIPVEVALQRHTEDIEQGRAAAYESAGAIIQHAKDMAAAYERDAQERHRQALGSLVRQREELERRVDDLRAFEREYRSRLRHYMETQVRNLYAETLNGPNADDVVEALRQEGISQGPPGAHGVILKGDGTYEEFVISDGPDADDDEDEREPRE
jgi:transcriptional regulator with XRE-family HTH domain